ncbi:MAG: GMC family oxidoreductase [Saprospiraceae bacterium]|nr:GMC family oxidoreductase [Saprospiraceae bacterium]
MTEKNRKYDVCVIGSGAGAGPVIYELSKAGFSVLVLEKGPWFRTSDFTKDELVATRRSVYTPNLIDERHVLESRGDDGSWLPQATYDTGNDFWNGNCVGGSSNFMSGFFQRSKPDDFRLLSEYGKIEGANIVDWPITYSDLEKYYTKVEQVVGVSGKNVPNKYQEPRSIKDFPYPPLQENIISGWIDKAAEKLNFDVVPIARAILSAPKDDRKECSYSNYCGSYGCSTDAKGSSRVALIHDALKTGNCTVIPNSKVFHLETDGNKRIIKAWYYDPDGIKVSVEAEIFVVAAQAVETSRLLLMSKNKEFPDGLSNNNGQVGKNLLFSAGGSGGGDFYPDDFSEQEAMQLMVPGFFVNRSLHEFYEFIDRETGNKIKGGTVDFLLEHANAMTKAINRKRDENGNLIYGKKFKNELKHYFTKVVKLKFEIFADWLPTDDCFVTIDDKVKDKWGDPVARIRTGYHAHDLKVGNFLAEKTELLLKEMGAKNIYSDVSGSAPPNLQAGGCRFGKDPKTSVLDPDCKSHEVENLFVSDGSFMPTGGSVTYTWTIYANAFRVADKIRERLR